MKRELLYTILPTDEYLTVEQVLKRRLNFSSKAIRRAKFLDDGISLDGIRVFTNHTVSQGQTLAFRIEGEGDSSHTIVPVPGVVDVVYEDPDILVVNKGRNTPVHPSPGHYDDTLANHIAHYYSSQGVQFVFRAVNRLDSNTSGLMIIAKNPHAHKVLGDQINRRQMCRTYNGIVVGHPSPNCGTIDAPIRRADPLKLLRIVAPDGQPAVTHYETLAQAGNRTLVQLRLETGRTHQIRVHMAHIGCPIVGDFLYGKEDAALISGHALHAKSLNFFHPLSGKPITLNSPLPPDMEQLMTL